MKNPKHNTCTVLLPNGVSRWQMKLNVQSNPTIDTNYRAVLIHVLDQAPGYIVTVRDVRSRLLWGEHRWVTTRKKLQEKGILVVSRSLLPDRSSCWSMSFDFNALTTKSMDHTHAPARACARLQSPPGPGI